jgi:hypothetical protein
LIELAQQPVQSRHTHIVNPLDIIAHDLRGDDRFFRHGNVARASTHNSDRSGAFSVCFFADRHAACPLVMHRVSKSRH